MADDTPTVEQARLAYDNAVVSTFDAVTPAERLQCEADVKQAWDALIAAVRAENAPKVAEAIDIATRLQGWDMLDTVTDGQYVRRQLDAIVAALLPKPS